MLQYFSGEATLALARMNLITGDAKYASATERGLDWLVHWYDFFVGGMMFGEEHWTCISAEAAFPTVHNPEYRAFCDAYGQFLRPQQAREAESGPNTFDMVGGYAGTPFVLPFNTPTSSRTEAMLSTYQLETHEGHADPVLWQQIETALAYLLGQQIREDNDFSVAAPDSRGAMPESPLERTVRIDYVQHSCSAMIRAAEILEADGR